MNMILCVVVIVCLTMEAKAWGMFTSRDTECPSCGLGLCTCAFIYYLSVPPVAVYLYHSV
jgi:hypothetical protein